MNFKGLNLDQLKSYIDEIQSISNADYGAFDALRIQEYTNAIDGLNDNQAALLLSTQGLNTAQIQQTLAVKGLNNSKYVPSKTDQSL